jgi:hypothetical protein
MKGVRITGVDTGIMIQVVLQTRTFLLDWPIEIAQFLRKLCIAFIEGIARYSLVYSRPRGPLDYNRGIAFYYWHRTTNESLAAGHAVQR